MLVDDGKESLLENVLGLLRRDSVAGEQRLEPRPDVPEELFEGSVDLKVVQGTHLPRKLLIA
jgi:hypothetical protein